jgi:hypothetical protein
MRFYLQDPPLRSDLFVVLKPQSRQSARRFFVCSNRVNFIRIQCVVRTEAFPWVAHLCGSIASVLVRVPSSLF